MGVGSGIGVGVDVLIGEAGQSKGSFGSQSSDPCAMTLGGSGVGKSATNASVAEDNKTGATTQIKSEASQPLRNLPTIRDTYVTLPLESIEVLF